MLENLFSGLFDSDLTTVISVTDFMLCLGCSLALGLVMALAYMYRTRYTKSFVVTLALLPAVVCIVIMMVNGNVGAGVAVAGVAVHSCHNLTLNVLLLQRLALPITFQHVEPQAVQLLHKFWPGCSRVDNTYGDRNFCCCDTLAQCE